MAYTGATGRHLIWKTGPGIIGDTTGFLKDIPASEIGRWLLVAIGVIVVLTAWGPAAYSTLRRRHPSSTPFEELKLRRAAEQGHAQAALELSRLIRGDDPGEADTWLKKSAALGNAAAMNEWAILLSESGNSDRAREWWLKSSELGNSDAAYRLGRSLPKIAQGPLPGAEDKPKTDYWTLSQSLTEGYEHRDAARHAGDRSALNEACSAFSTWALSVNKWMQINHPALFATLPQTAPWALQGKGKAVDLMDAYLNALAKVARRLKGYE